MLVLAGLYSFHELDIEAYPRSGPAAGRGSDAAIGLSAEGVEKLVAVPLEYELASTRNLAQMDSISLFGLSDIRLFFDWASDDHWDRVETINQLPFVPLA